MSDSLHFSATTKQIRIAEQAAIEITLPEPKAERAKPKKNMGKQESKPAAPVVKKSMFDKVFDKLFDR